MTPPIRDHQVALQAPSTILTSAAAAAAGLRRPLPGSRRVTVFLRVLRCSSLPGRGTTRRRRRTRTRKRQELWHGPVLTHLWTQSGPGRFRPVVNDIPGNEKDLKPCQNGVVVLSNLAKAIFTKLNSD